MIKQTKKSKNKIALKLDKNNLEQRLQNVGVKKTEQRQQLINIAAAIGQEFDRVTLAYFLSDNLPSGVDFHHYWGREQWLGTVVLNTFICEGCLEDEDEDITPQDIWMSAIEIQGIATGETRTDEDGESYPLFKLFSITIHFEFHHEEIWHYTKNERIDQLFWGYKLSLPENSPLHKELDNWWDNFEENGEISVPENSPLYPLYKEVSEVSEEGFDGSYMMPDTENPYRISVWDAIGGPDVRIEKITNF